MALLVIWLFVIFYMLYFSQLVRDKVELSTCTVVGSRRLLFASWSWLTFLSEIGLRVCYSLLGCI